MFSFSIYLIQLKIFFPVYILEIHDSEVDFNNKIKTFEFIHEFYILLMLYFKMVICFYPSNREEFTRINLKFRFVSILYKPSFVYSLQTIYNDSC